MEGQTLEESELIAEMEKHTIPLESFFEKGVLKKEFRTPEFRAIVASFLSGEESVISNNIFKQVVKGNGKLNLSHPQINYRREKSPQYFEGSSYGNSKVETSKQIIEKLLEKQREREQLFNLEESNKLKLFEILEQNKLTLAQKSFLYLKYQLSNYFSVEFSNVSSSKVAILIENLPGLAKWLKENKYDHILKRNHKGNFELGRHLLKAYEQ